MNQRTISLLLRALSKPPKRATTTVNNYLSNIARDTRERGILASRKDDTDPNVPSTMHTFACISRLFPQKLWSSMSNNVKDWPPSIIIKFLLASSTDQFLVANWPWIMENAVKMICGWRRCHGPGVKGSQTFKNQNFEILIVDLESLQKKYESKVWFFFLFY